MKSVIVKGSARALSRTISASLLKGGWMDKPGSFAYMGIDGRQQESTLFRTLCELGE
jgi:hypothetical protein